MIMGGLGLVVVVAVAFMLMGGEEKKPSKPKDQGNQMTAGPKKSNLDTPAKKTETPKASGNAHSQKDPKYDMAKLRPLKAKVNMDDWKKVDSLISEAYKLKSRALEARKGKDEAGFKKLITQAVDTWRKGYNVKDA